MITVEIFSGNDEKILGYQVSGHAGFADSGEDIVCAAVSGIVQTAVLGLDHYLSVSPNLEIKDGWLKCMLPDTINIEELEKAQIILRTMELGLLSTQESYNKYIRIIKRRWI